MGDCDWDPTKSGASGSIPVYPGNTAGGVNNMFTPSPKPKMFSQFSPFSKQRTPNPMPAASSGTPFNSTPLLTFNSSQRSENLLQDLRLKIGQNMQQANGTVFAFWRQVHANCIQGAEIYIDMLMLYFQAAPQEDEQKVYVVPYIAQFCSR